MKLKNKIIAFLLALLVQIGIGGLIFVAGLLDPLLGIWALGIYFFVIGLYLMYRYLLMRLFKEKFVLSNRAC